MTRGAPRARFDAKTGPATGGCIEWRGATVPKGYGKFYDGQRLVYAHRWSYEQAVGPIPEGMQIDHLCRNTRCVNPEHLEPVTPRENLRRGKGWAGRNAAKTHCPAGHPYSGHNLVMSGPGRRCRACHNSSQRAFTKRSAARKGA